MKILITGGGGFLGSSLAKKLLILGNEVTILGRQSYPKLKKMFHLYVSVSPNSTLNSSGIANNKRETAS